MSTLNGNKTYVLGIGFFKGDVSTVIRELKSGGLLLVPSGPGLVTIRTEHVYYQALLTGDIVIPDSGYMILLWKLLRWERIPKISGLRFLVAFFADEDVKRSRFVLVNPRPSEAKANFGYLNSIGFSLDEQEDGYVAPMYDKSNIVDPELLAFIEKKRPQYVLLNLGGGVQEVLGAYLRRNLSYKPAIICTGAAIAFLTGHQATIPTWADRLYIGWLMRCIQNPKVFVPRYLGAFKLIWLIVRFGRKSPTPK